MARKMTVKIGIPAQKEAAEKLLREIPSTKEGFRYQAIMENGQSVFCNGKVWMILDEPSEVLENAAFTDDYKWITPDGRTKYSYEGLAPHDSVILDIYDHCTFEIGELTPAFTRYWVSHNNPVRLDLNRHYGYIPYVIEGRTYNAMFLDNLLEMICSKTSETVKLSKTRIYRHS